MPDVIAVENTLNNLDSWLSAHLPDGAVSIVAPVADHTEDLHHDEIPFIAKAIDKRRREFSTGRHLARQACTRLGHRPQAIPIGTQRAPVWPNGICASITHTDEICAVIAGDRPKFTTMGIDLEHIAKVNQAVADRVSHPEERAKNANQLAAGDLRACLFSIRETVFKAYYPATETYLDYLDVSLTLDASDGRFKAHIINDEKPDFCGNRSVDGHFALMDGFVMSLVAN